MKREIRRVCAGCKAVVRRVVVVGGRFFCVRCGAAERAERDAKRIGRAGPPRCPACRLPVMAGTAERIAKEGWQPAADGARRVPVNADDVPF